MRGGIRGMCKGRCSTYHVAVADGHGGDGVVPHQRREDRLALHSQRARRLAAHKRKVVPLVRPIGTGRVAVRARTAALEHAVQARPKTVVRGHVELQRARGLVQARAVDRDHVGESDARRTADARCIYAQQVVSAARGRDDILRSSRRDCEL